MDSTKTRIAAWMRKEISKNNWTAEEWARQAGTSPTNITRFLKGEAFLPSGNTLIKLATAANSTPPIGPELLSPRTEVPFYEDFMNNIIKGPFFVPGEVSSSAFAVEIDEDTMSLGGILPGDTLVCEPENVREIRSGSIIAYIIDGTLNVGKLYQPYLMPSSSNPIHVPINVKDASIIGTVVKQVRDLV